MKKGLQIAKGQRHLTPEQKAEALRFALERIRVQLSTELVNEPEAEHLLQQAYKVAGLRAPRRIHWLDGPLQLLVFLVSARRGKRQGERQCQHLGQP